MNARLQRTSNFTKHLPESISIIIIIPIHNRVGIQIRICGYPHWKLTHLLTVDDSCTILIVGQWAVFSLLSDESLLSSCGNILLLQNYIESE